MRVTWSRLWRPTASLTQLTRLKSCAERAVAMAESHNAAADGAGGDRGAAHLGHEGCADDH